MWGYSQFVLRQRCTIDDIIDELQKDKFIQRVTWGRTNSPRWQKVTGDWMGRDDHIFRFELGIQRGEN